MGPCQEGEGSHFEGRRSGHPNYNKTSTKEATLIRTENKNVGSTCTEASVEHTWCPVAHKTPSLDPLSLFYTTAEIYCEQGPS